MDPFLYYRFKNLTPQIAKHEDSGELYYRWDKHYGHPANWTKRNAKFCLDLCVDTALKFQRGEDEGYTLIPYPLVYEDIIEPSRDEAVIWSQPYYSTGPLFGGDSEQKRPVLVLKKGQSLVGWASDSAERLDEWFITSENLPETPGGHAGFGWVLKSDVTITRRERQTPKEAGSLQAETRDEASDT